MKAFIKFVFTMICLFTIITNTSHAQNPTDTTIEDTTKTYIIIKNDGTEFVGKILSRDAREILIDTKTIGQVLIPKHEIRIINEISEKSKLEDEKIIFATRYFITTNGLPIRKGESYILWNTYGPDFQFGIGKNVGLGIMTSWFGIPIIGTLKYSHKLQDNVHIGLGALLGTGSWAQPKFGIALPFAALTFGDTKNNLNFSGGYGAIFTESSNEGRFLISIAGTTKLSRTFSLVFDSFIVPAGVDKNSSEFALLIPGVRFQTESNKAFQFGFAAISFDGEFAPMPMPFIQWYRKL